MPFCVCGLKHNVTGLPNRIVSTLVVAVTRRRSLPARLDEAGNGSNAALRPRNNFFTAGILFAFER